MSNQTLLSHTLNVTATMDTGESTTMTLLVFNQVPVSRLQVKYLDADGNLWMVTTNPLEASITGGSHLTAEWLFGDTEIVYQVSSGFTSV